MNSIGEHSLCNRIHGECEAIAAQVPEGGNKEFWKLFFKLVAVQLDGYPAKNYSANINGREARVKIPLSLAKVGDAEAMKVQMEIQVFADERGYWLWEYRKKSDADHLVYRSLNGRTYDEMQIYIKEVREMAEQARTKDPEEATKLEARADELAVTRTSRNPAGSGLPNEKPVKPEAKQPDIF